MKRNSLILNITGIYNQAATMAKSRLLSSTATSTASLLTEQQSVLSKIAQDVDCDEMSTAHSAAKANLESMIAIANNEASRYAKAAEGISVDAMAQEYIRSVQSFTAEGKTGFYDVGIVMPVLYSEKSNQILDIVEELASSGMDVKVVDKQLGFAASHYEGHIAVILPSSAIEAFDEAMQPAFNGQSLFNTGKRNGNAYVYFIPPFIHGEIENDEQQIRDIIAERSDQFDRFDVRKVMAGFAGIGYRTVECNRVHGTAIEGITNAIADVLSSVTLHSKFSSDHINGMAPTVFAYDEEEVAKYAIDTTHFTDGVKPLNIIDDLKRCA